MRLNVRKIRKYFTLLLWAVLLCTAAGALSEAKIGGWSVNKKYQYASFGSYPQTKEGGREPVLWRVLSTEDNKALLLSEYILDTYPILWVDDQKAIEKKTFRRITSITESDLFVYLREKMLPGLFDEAQQNALIEEGRGKVFILSREEYLISTWGFSASVYGEQPKRQCKATPWAVKQGVYVGEKYNSGYWTSTIKSLDGVRMQIVGFNGHMSYAGYTRRDIGLRVGILLDLDKMEVTGGLGTKQDPWLLAAVPGKDKTASSPENSTSPVKTPDRTPNANQAKAITTAPSPSLTPSPTASPAGTATAAPIPTTTLYPSAKDDTLLLSFLGDVSIGDAFQNRKSKTGYHGTVAEKGYDWPFSLVRNILENDDLTLANLEVVLTDRTKHLSKAYPLIASPKQAEVLKQSGIDAVNTVNNHAFDFLNAGYRDTLSTLDAAGIPHFGTDFGDQEPERDQITVFEAKGVKVGLIGFSYPQNNDIKRIQERIVKLREQGCKLVIVSLHWGREEKPLPNVGQFSFAKEMIDGGADVVYGHHPHVLQPIHLYKGKPIFYSTGNFTFGTMSAVDPDTGIFQLRYTLSEGNLQLSNLTVLPCRTQGAGDYRPYILTDDKAREAVFRKLVFRKVTKGMDNLPESFLKTGSADFQ